MTNFIRSHRKASILFGVLFGVLSLLVGVAYAKRISPLSWKWYGEIHAPAGLAIDGYDPVAYHRAGTATRGDGNFHSQWHGAIWHFTSDENRKLFEANPAQYAPQFGGFCSYASSKGFTAKTDPTVWRIEDGALYLFNDAGMRDNWVAELEEGVIEKGKRAWQVRGPR